MADHPAGLDLAAIERFHYERPTSPECGQCRQEWPCDAWLLLSEVRRLEAVAAAAREVLGSVDGFDHDGGAWLATAEYPIGVDGKTLAQLARALDAPDVPTAAQDGRGE